VNAWSNSGDVGRQWLRSDGCGLGRNGGVGSGLAGNAGRRRRLAGHDAQGVGEGEVGGLGVRVNRGLGRCDGEDGGRDDDGGAHVGGVKGKTKRLMEEGNDRTRRVSRGREAARMCRRW